MKIAEAMSMIMEDLESHRFLRHVDKFISDDRPDCCDKCGELYDTIRERSNDMVAEMNSPDMPPHAQRAVLVATALITLVQIMHQVVLDDDSSPESANDNSGG